MARQQREITHHEIRGITTNTTDVAPVWSHSLEVSFSNRVRGSLSAFRNAHSLTHTFCLHDYYALSSQASLPFSFTCSEIGSHKIGQRMININIPANYHSFMANDQPLPAEHQQSPLTVVLLQIRTPTQLVQMYSMSEQLWTGTQGLASSEVSLLSLFIGWLIRMSQINFMHFSI